MMTRLGKLPGVGVQLIGLFTTPEGSWDGDQDLGKLSGVVVQVTGWLQHLE